MKILPNLITISRMLLCLLLPVLINDSELFIVVFLICGITDVLDGYLARRLKSMSTLGARLDSIADSMLFLIMTYCTMRIIGGKLRDYVVLLLLIIGIRAFNLLFAYYKYKCFVMIHTLANKATGLCIYLMLLLYLMTPWAGFVLIALIFALLSAMEESLIHITQKTPDPNKKGLFL